MGTRAPVGLPGSVHRLRGTVAHAGRGGVATAPVKLRPSTPGAPQWLDAEAAAEWQRVVPELDAQGLLAAVDRAVLVAYCSSWSTLVRTIAELAEVESITVQGARGTVKASQFLAWRDASTVHMTLAAKVLCTPSDRLRMRLPDVADSDADRILD